MVWTKLFIEFNRGVSKLYAAVNFIFQICLIKSQEAFIKKTQLMVNL